MNAHQAHALYRFYADDGTLLYVGITNNPGSRFARHGADKPWWQQVTNITIETHPTRTAVLDAERAAIVTEKPAFNVVHNRGRTRVPEPAQPVRPPSAGLTYDDPANLWTFRSRISGHERTVPLHYHWEVSGTPMSDDWLPSEIDAYDLLLMWAKRYGKQQVSIYWSLEPVGETAPFQQPSPWADDRNFLNYLTWPINAHTGERINFNRIPVADLGWNDLTADKGGFFQEATGWKPAPLAGLVNLREVFQAAGISTAFIAQEATA